jgi:Protein of unknown function (DUF1573)
MFRFLQTLPFLICSLVSMSQENARIQFVQEELDYGLIKQGSDGKRSFIFKNTGNAPLLISSCRGSCGCTVPTCPLDAVLPNRAGVVDVVYDTKRPGPFNKTVTVVSNAVNIPTMMLRIVGVVEVTGGASPLQLNTPVSNYRRSY